MIYISCSDEEYGKIRDIVTNPYGVCFLSNECEEDCFVCFIKNIKRIKTDIKPENPNYNTEAENKAYLQGFNVAVKKMRGDLEE